MKLKKIDIKEIEGFRLGNAENAEAGTGVTVVIAERGAVAGVDVRGGGPATRETDLLRSENTVDKINAVVLSGGSAFGLEAASGVMRALAERGQGFRVGNVTVPIVTGASLFDLAVGKSDVFPDVQMGKDAVRNAFTEEFEAGNHGAGTGASVGKMLGMDRAMKTGIGTFACGDGLIEVGAISAVNACADIYNGAGNIIAGLRNAAGTEIQGTVKVLKGMIHPESEPDLPEETESEPVLTGDEDEINPEPETITVTGENVTLYPLDSLGNPDEDAGAASLSFTDFGSVEARADGDVEYWIVNGIRVTPNENVTSVRLQNITSDIIISAVLPAPEEAVLDSGDRVQVTCVGCRFTYMADNLVSVTSGSVPRGADIIVMADAKAAEGGYSVNGGEYVRQGKVSFRLTVTENTEIKTK